MHHLFLRLHGSHGYIPPYHGAEIPRQEPYGYIPHHFQKGYHGLHGPFGPH